jgi:hypothetical protein
VDHSWISPARKRFFSKKKDLHFAKASTEMCAGGHVLAAKALSPKTKTNRQGRQPPKGNHKRKYFTTTDKKDLSPALNRLMSQELQHGTTETAAIDLVDDNDDDDYAPPDWAHHTDGQEGTDLNTSKTNNNEES